MIYDAAPALQLRLSQLLAAAQAAAAEAAAAEAAAQRGEGAAQGAQPDEEDGELVRRRERVGLAEQAAAPRPCACSPGARRRASLPTHPTLPAPRTPTATTTTGRAAGWH